MESKPGNVSSAAVGGLAHSDFGLPVNHDIYLLYHTFSEMQAQIVLFVFLFVTGCGASALDKAATVLGSAYVAQATSVDATSDYIEADLIRHCEDVEDKQTCVTDRVEDWRATAAGFDVSASALDEAAVEVMRWAASESDEDIVPPSACESLQKAVETVLSSLSLARALGVSVPGIDLEFSCGED